MIKKMIWGYNALNLIIEDIESLRILLNISKSLNTNKRSNYSRIKNNKKLSDDDKQRLINQVISPLDMTLLEIGNEISFFLNGMPIYRIFLNKVKTINIFDAAELICEIRDINRFKNFNNLLAYAGFCPNPKSYNKRLHSLLLRVSHKLSEYNPIYSFVFETACEKYEFEKDTSVEHIEAMARRIVIKKFLQNLFINWKSCEKR